MVADDRAAARCSRPRSKGRRVAARGPTRSRSLVTGCSPSRRQEWRYRHGKRGSTTPRTPRVRLGRLLPEKAPAELHRDPSMQARPIDGLLEPTSTLSRALRETVRGRVSHCGTGRPRSGPAMDRNVPDPDRSLATVRPVGGRPRVDLLPGAGGWVPMSNNSGV